MPCTQDKNAGRAEEGLGENRAFCSEQQDQQQQAAERQTSESTGLDLGPIAMSFGSCDTERHGKSRMRLPLPSLNVQYSLLVHAWSRHSLLNSRWAEQARYRKKEHPHQWARAYTA